MQRRKLARLGITAAVIGSAFAGVAVYQAGASPATPPSSLIAITPCRLIDTRAAAPVGTRSTPLQNQETATFDVWGVNGNCNIPNTALGIATNTTIVNPTAASYLTLWPADDPQPLASNLNWTPTSSPTPNQVTVGLSTTDGKVKMFNNAGTVDVIVDIVGYYVPLSQGPKGDRGVSSFDNVGFNTTLKGEAVWQLYSKAGTPNRFDIDMPARAFAALADNKVNFANDPDAGDADAACTGTFENPTAPAGKVCLYIQNKSNATNFKGEALDSQTDAGFKVLFDTVADGTFGVNVSWAYRSPSLIILDPPIIIGPVDEQADTPHGEETVESVPEGVNDPETGA